jgi:hypothetical protein
VEGAEDDSLRRRTAVALVADVKLHSRVVDVVVSTYHIIVTAMFLKQIMLQILLFGMISEVDWYHRKSLGGNK